MNYWLLLIPLLTALCAWLIIRLIHFMLFHPVKPVKIAGISFQGIIYQFHQPLAARLARLAATEFSSMTALEGHLDAPGNFETVKPVIEAHMDDFLRNRLKEQMPMVGMLIGDKTIQSLKLIFIQEIEDLFPKVMHQFTGNLQKTHDIEQIVHSRVMSTRPENLVLQVREGLKPAFRKTYLLAISTGLLIGIIQLLIMLAFFK